MAQNNRPTPPNRIPPFADERMDSRIGLTTGLIGAQNVTRTWNVYCSSSSASPVQTILNLSSKDGGVKIGESFPKSGGWGDGTYVLGYLTIVDRWIGTNVWIVQGHYIPSYIGSFSSSLWEFNIRGSLQTERIYTTLPMEDVPSKGIGPPRYKVFAPPQAAPGFSAVHPEKGTVQFNLAEGSDPTAASLPRYMEGADVPLRISTLTLWKTIPTWNFGAVASAWNNKNYVNSDDVIVNTTSGVITFSSNQNGGRGIMMLDELSLDPIPPGQGTTPAIGIGPAFRIALTIKINPDKWQHKRRHTHKWDDGTESPIKDLSTGDFIDEDFFVIGETSFSAIIGAFV